MNSPNPLILWFEHICAEDITIVGGKNASLGEMFRSLSKEGIKIPNGFALTTAAYFMLLGQSDAHKTLKQLLGDFDKDNVKELRKRGRAARELILSLEFPGELREQISLAYQSLGEKCGTKTPAVAVRSSATAEDLAEASFAGQQESFLNIRGERALINACHQCFASLFTDRAISYRIDQGFDHFKVALSIGIQQMVRSDVGCSGVMFTVDTETGFSDAIVISAAYGLGETIVKGEVNPDEYCVFKPTLAKGFHPIIEKTIGSKRIMMVYGKNQDLPTKKILVSLRKQKAFVLQDDDILKLAKWGVVIEKHYSKKKKQQTPMDIEWAIDGKSKELYIVQARPETVTAKLNTNIFKQYRLNEKGNVLLQGRAVGQSVGAGRTRVIKKARDLAAFKAGEVLVTDSTDPDWEPIMKKAAAVVTNRGGRTSHAAIVSRELGIPCIVGTGQATTALKTGTEVTVSCAAGDIGRVYAGLLSFSEQELDRSELPPTRTKICLNVGSPDDVFALTKLPNNGVGLARTEFIFSSTIGIHPLALINFETIKNKSIRKQIKERTLGYENKTEFFVQKLAQGVGKIVAAFYPKPVIVRLSDFKSNEYAKLIGGELFEPNEENPMIGWRGASRYYAERYREGFALECIAMKKVLFEYGLTNLKLMIPFCRTVEEAKRVIEVMAQHGLHQGSKKGEVEIYGMCEIPANVILADEFLNIFDGFSIGTNDLTQLTLGLDRDSELVADLFDEQNDAVKNLVQKVIEVANRKGKYIGLCGDAPSTYPDFARFLVQAGIGSLSLSPDAVIKTTIAVAEMERELRMRLK